MAAEFFFDVDITLMGPPSRRVRRRSLFPLPSLFSLFSVLTHPAVEQLNCINWTELHPAVEEVNWTASCCRRTELNWTELREAGGSWRNNWTATTELNCILLSKNWTELGEAGGSWRMLNWVWGSWRKLGKLEEVGGSWLKRVYYKHLTGSHEHELQTEGSTNPILKRSHSWTNICASVLESTYGREGVVLVP